VTLDRDFAAIAQTDDYRVFLMPLADCKDMYATALTAGGFEVHEVQGGTSAAGFHWRVVARPKVETKAQRLAKFTVPNIKIPGMIDLPKPPTPPATSPAPQVGGGTSNPAVQPIPQPRSG
jgi:hypothetical protein